MAAELPSKLAVKERRVSMSYSSHRLSRIDAAPQNRAWHRRTIEPNNVGPIIPRCQAWDDKQRSPADAASAIGASIVVSCPPFSRVGPALPAATVGLLLLRTSAGSSYPT